MRSTSSSKLNNYLKILDLEDQNKSPSLYDNYYNLPFDNEYICVSTHGLSSKFKHWNDLIQILKEIFGDRYVFVQVGETSDLVLKSVIPILSTLPEHFHYVLSHCSLLISEENHFCHFSRFLGKKCVTLTDSKDPPFKESEMQANAGKGNVETILNKCLRLLGEEEVNWETEHMGRLSHFNVFEIIPEFLPPLKYSENSIFVIRNDLKADNDYLDANLKNLPCHIITEEAIPFQILKARKHHIIEIVYKITGNIDFQFLDDLEKSGVNYNVVNCSNLNIRLMKEKLLDYNCLVNEINKDLKIEFKKDTEYSLRTNRRILSKKGLYFSDYFYKKDIPCGLRSMTLLKKDLTNKLFEQDCEYYWITSNKI